MKVIDKTPFQDEQGNINMVARAQGTLQFGLSWYPELEAQKKVIGQLDRMLDKGCVAIRNFTLPGSEIVIPIILICPGNMYVILATPVRGQFEAKGAEWNTMSGNGVSTPARRNLIDLLVKLSRAFQKYLQIQKIHIPVQIESVLIASDPGAQIESLRPIVRVLRSDAIKPFATSANQARPVLRTDSMMALAERIISPKTAEQLAEENAAKAERPASPAPAASPETNESAIGFDANALGFEFNEEPETEAAQPKAPAPIQKAQARPQPPTPAKAKGLSRNQKILLAGMILFEVCVIVAGAGALFLLNP
ncbi:MAG TPA: hypothetical protein PK078_06815 [Anaerolineales bacterium]|nr:hypothetical protein [Anaerolineales bacterium]HNC08240.1 hypothetical protein [Anaerolineales bacterium]